MSEQTIIEQARVITLLHVKANELAQENLTLKKEVEMLRNAQGQTENEEAQA